MVVFSADDRRDVGDAERMGTQFACCSRTNLRSSHVSCWACRHGAHLVFAYTLLETRTES